MRAPHLLGLAVSALLCVRCGPVCDVDADCGQGERCVDGYCVSINSEGGDAQGNLTVSPATAALQAEAGQPTPGTSFTVGNDGHVQLNFAISCDTGTPTPSRGMLPYGRSQAVALVLPTWTTPGARRAVCSVSTSDATGGPLQFAAAVDVTADATPPAVAVTAPTPAARLAGTATLTAAASDAIGVTSVDFLVDGALVGTASAAPFAVTWHTTGVPNGSHAISAIARDAAGNSGTSSAIPVRVLNAYGALVSIHTALGLPDNSSTETNSYLSVKHQYVVSYNGVRRVPNWVSWELNASGLGPVARQDDFRPDDTLPAGFPQAQLADYLNSGWDRGHMCPSDDRTLTILDNQNTFYLTNMVPQSDNMNGGPWERLEVYSRQLATSGKELFIVSGGAFTAPPKTIGADAVQVP